MNKITVHRGLFVTATLLYWISLYLYVPTLPTYVQLKSADLAVVGTVLSMYGLWQAFVRIPVGIGVDRHGRGRPFIVLGFVFSLSGALVLSVGENAAVLAVGRALTGVAAGTWVPLIAVFSGFFEPKRAVFATSLITFSASFGRVISTSMNGFLIELGGYRLSFLLAAGAAACAAIIIFLLPEKKRPTGSVSFARIGTLFKRGDVMFPACISLVGQIGNWAITFGFLPILAGRLGAGDVTKSLLVSLNLLALAVGNLFNTMIIDRVRHIPLLLVSITFFAGGVVLCAVAPGVELLLVATAVMGLANGFSYPTLMGLSIHSVDQSLRTSAMGIHQSVYAVGMFTGPWIGGIIAEVAGIRFMFGVAAAFIVLASAGLLLFYSRTVIPHPDRA